MLWRLVKDQGEEGAGWKVQDTARSYFCVFVKRLAI